jgi:hypothetical protein
MTKLWAVWFVIINVILLINPKTPSGKVIAIGSGDNIDSIKEMKFLVDDLEKIPT